MPEDSCVTSYTQIQKWYFFVLSGFASDLAGYRLVYMSTSLGPDSSLVSRCWIDCASMFLNRASQQTMSLQPTGHVAMSRDIFACHSSGNEERMILLSSKGCAVHTRAPHNNEPPVPTRQ